LEFFSRYWPTLLGIVVVGIVAKLLVPESEESVRPPHRIMAEERADLVDDPEQMPESPKMDDLRRTVVTPTRAEPAQEPDSRPSSEDRVRDTPSLDQPIAAPAHTLTQDDEEVKVALARVQVELYEADWCPHCRRARQFLRSNGITYSSHDVDHEPGAKERAHELTGRGGIPVIVIDGEVLQGFSDAAVSAGLKQAVARRLGR
jgi:glutaredoxin